jgi:hypothetical protein
MALLTAGKTLRSRTPTLLVENRLAPGSYRFRLVVIDNERNPSAPVELLVKVVSRQQSILPTSPLSGLSELSRVLPETRTRTPTLVSPGDTPGDTDTEHR